MSDGDAARAQARRASWLWGAAFLAGTFGVAGASLIFSLPPLVGAALFVGGMLLLIPFVRAIEAANALAGNLSLATTRYNRRMIAASMAYVATLIASVLVAKHLALPPAALVPVAIAPALPVLGMIWAMARLLIEEDDEYLKAQAAHHALVATGLTLALATVWGFLEQFGLVMHLPSYLVFPLWAVCLGISRCLPGQAA